MKNTMIYFYDNILTPIGLIIIFILGVQGLHERPKKGISYYEQTKIFQANLAKEIEEREKKESNMRRAKPRPRAQTLDDGLERNSDVRDLMKGLRGFL